jgi:hypothetical protein
VAFVSFDETSTAPRAPVAPNQQINRAAIAFEHATFAHVATWTKGLSVRCSAKARTDLAYCGAGAAGTRRPAKAIEVLLPNFGIGVHMDVTTRSRSKSPDRGNARKLDGYTIHLLKLDGTVATVGNKRRDGTVKLTVEVRDRTGERRIPVKLARNPRSPEFARAVGEMKAELLQRRRDARLS